MLISITIPVYNNREGLEISLKSLVNQTYEKWEAIVVDDGSMDSLVDVVEKIGDSRVVFFRQEQNLGRPLARQKTFELLTGEYCGFLDAGDYYEKDYIANAVEILKGKNILGISQSMKILYKNNTYNSVYENRMINITDVEYKKMSFASTIFQASICKNYVFNPKLRYSQDRHFLNHLANTNKGLIYMLDSKNYVYDQGDNMRFSTTFFKYYYDSLRLYEEREFLESTFALVKGIVMITVHLLFGYEKILQLRFKKE